MPSSCPHRLPASAWNSKQHGFARSLFGVSALLALIGTTVPKLEAATVYWDTDGKTAGAGGTAPSGTWTTSNSNQNWTAFALGDNKTTSAWTDNDIARFSAGSTATGSFTVTLGSAVFVDSIYVDQGSPTISGAQIMTLTGSALINVATSSVITINSQIGGTVGLTKANAGTLIFSTTGKTYTGATTVSGGILQLDASNQIADTSNLSIASGATFQFGTGSFSDTVGSLSGSGTLGLNTSALTTTNSADTTFSGTITGGTGGTFTKAGTNALTLDTANTYTGATIVSGGALVVRNSAALGTSSTGNVISSGGALHLGSGVTVTETDFTVNGTGVSSGGAIRNVDGNNTLAANVTLGTASSLVNASGTLAVSGTVGLGANTLTVVGGSGTTFSGSIQGSGGYTQTGGTVAFSGSSANTYTGTTNVTAGTLSLGKTAGVNALAGGAINIGSGATLNLLASEQIANNSGLLTLSSGGTLQLNTFTETIDTLAGAGLIDLGASGHLALGANNGSSTFGGSVTGSGILEKLGSGSLTFNSSLNFTGELRLGGGTMALNGNNLTVTTLHITANSVIDFGTSTASILSASTLVIDTGVTLTINGWADMVDYFMAGAFSGATVEVRGSGSAAQVVFSGYSGSNTLWNKYGEVTPVPEPSTYGLLFMALATGGYVWHRRRRA